MVLWQEMLPGDNGKLVNPLLESQYDLVYGSWPTEYNEIVLVLDENNELDDMALYALGLKSEEEIDAIMEAAIHQTELEVETQKWSYNLDERVFHYCQKREGFDLKAVETQTAIIHYNGKYKPWLDGYKGKLDYFYPDIVPKGPAPVKTLRKQIKSIYRITRPTKQQAVYIVGLLLFVCICLFSWIYFGTELTKIIDEPVRFRDWLEQFGAFDEIVFILIRAAQTVIKFIPAEPLEIASGYAWGAIPGMLYCVIGNLIGTIVILFLTRRFGQRFIELFLPVKNMQLVSIFKSSEKMYGLLFVLYLIPGSPKDGFTYFVGLFSIRIVPFMVITGIARMPSVLSSTLCGAAFAEKQYGVSLLIFAATIVLAVLGGLLYRKYMKKKAVVT